MCRLSFLILFLPLVFGGCLEQQQESEYERVSREIEETKAEYLARSAETKAGNIKIVINMLSTGVSDYSLIDTLWRYTNQNITVARNPEVFSRSGLKVGVADDNFKAQLNIVKKQLKSSEDTELFIVVSDGSPGYIFVGKEIPVARFFYFGYWYSSVGYDFRRAGRSLQVVAHKRPTGMIDLELTPVFSNFKSGSGALELTELTTKVSVRPGQPVVIGGSDRDGEDVATALLSYEKENRKSKTLITVTAELQ